MPCRRLICRRRKNKSLKMRNAMYLALCNANDGFRQKLPRSIILLIIIPLLLLINLTIVLHVAINDWFWKGGTDRG